MRPEGNFYQTKMNITFASCGKSELRQLYQTKMVRNNPGLNQFVEN
uniref:Uncharacterized protein n=1 Tax=Meloidogyne enterolobii TaxID=390850 RepID=A0A6V7WSQ7_MELEN|nr:unnamed protein product [Meloidogyne enterolobii]